MEKEINSLYIKRTQRDYSMSFKLSVVQEVESGSIGIKAIARKYGIQSYGTVREWCRKYGNFASEYQTKAITMQSPQQKIKELEQKLRQMERQNKFLEEQLLAIEDKAAILDKLIDMAEKEYIIPIRKNCYPDQSANMAKQTRKR